MEDLCAVRAALANAIDDAQSAIAGVRAAQEVDWVSVFAGRYREELHAAIEDLVVFRERLEAIRAGLS